jgi:glucan phosphoethanolaminetransferase (alkaline phosphatase superfamily)
MAEGQVQTRIQAVVMTYFPMFIAALSLCTSIYNGYLNNKFVDLIQNNTARVESLRTCKEIIDAYFQDSLPLYYRVFSCVTKSRKWQGKLANPGAVVLASFALCYAVG